MLLFKLHEKESPLINYFLRFVADLNFLINVN